MDRETVLWALVFSVPVGVGMIGFVADVLGGSALNPLAIAAGAVVALVLFTIIAFAASVGSVDESRVGEP